MQQKLINQSYKIKVTPPGIYGLRGIQIKTHIFAHESDFKKPGVRCPSGMPGLKMYAR